ncbi:hypothetical protein B0H14DRAFT_2637791 [Mycena olivaceomarginata]|nr:hypothetical protein B0H14DRAFT_2637791 [Mycena olivaceomarginata]
MHGGRGRARCVHVLTKQTWNGVRTAHAAELENKCRCAAITIAFLDSPWRRNSRSAPGVFLVDVIAGAKELQEEIGSIGAYLHSQGVPFIRKSVARLLRYFSIGARESIHKDTGPKLDAELRWSSATPMGSTHIKRLDRDGASSPRWGSAGRRIWAEDQGLLLPALSHSHLRVHRQNYIKGL